MSALRVLIRSDSTEEEGGLLKAETRDTLYSWEREWKQMPEFNQKDAQLYREVLVRFLTKEDFEKFCALIGQRLTENTKSIWYPKKGIQTFMDKRWIDESEVSDIRSQQKPLGEQADGEGARVDEGAVLRDSGPRPI